MKNLFIIILTFLSIGIYAQSISQIITEKNKRPIQVGDSAPDILVTVGSNSIRSFALKSTKRITLLHFWNSETANSITDRRHLTRILENYKNASYINANGFEVIAIAVQSDMNAWKNAIERDSMFIFTNGLAIKGLEDEVCKNYNLTALPDDILVDEKGVIIAINPRYLELENLLDERKNFQSLKNDISATLSFASNKNDVLRFGRLYLFNYYGDSIAKAMTNSRGVFSLHDLKLNQNFILKVDNQSNIVTSDPLALYSRDGDFVMNATTQDGGFVFNITTRIANGLIVRDSALLTKHAIEQIDVIKTLTFSGDGSKLTHKDEKELNIIVFDMLKSPNDLYMEYFVHTDSKSDAEKAMELTSNQVMAIKNYFQRKGLDLCHITGVAKGNTEMRKQCSGQNDCSEADHKINRRVEFVIYKELPE